MNGVAISCLTSPLRWRAGNTVRGTCTRNDCISLDRACDRHRSAPQTHRLPCALLSLAPGLHSLRSTTMGKFVQARCASLTCRHLLNSSSEHASFEQEIRQIPHCNTLTHTTYRCGSWSYCSASPVHGFSVRNQVTPAWFRLRRASTPYGIGSNLLIQRRHGQNVSWHVK